MFLLQKILVPHKAHETIFFGFKIAEHISIEN